MDLEILKEFSNESRKIVQDSQKLLESIENEPDNFEILEKYSNQIDRIMGGASTLALDLGPEHILNVTSYYAGISKSLSRRAHQLKENMGLVVIFIAVLLDMNEIIEMLLEKMESTPADFSELVNQEFLTRLNWVVSELIQRTPPCEDNDNLKIFLSKLEQAHQLT